MKSEWNSYLPMPADPSSVPLSFLCGEKRITGMEESFSPLLLSDKTEGTVRTVVWEGSDSTGLTIRAEAKTYADYPVVEWLAFLENRGCENSASLSDIRLGVCTLPLKNPILQYSNGDNRRQEAFSRFETVLRYVLLRRVSLYASDRRQPCRKSGSRLAGTLVRGVYPRCRRNPCRRRTEKSGTLSEARRNHPPAPGNTDAYRRRRGHFPRTSGAARPAL